MFLLRCRLHRKAPYLDTLHRIFRHVSESLGGLHTHVQSPGTRTPTCAEDPKRKNNPLSIYRVWKQEPFILSIFILIPIVQTAVCSVFKSFWIFCSQSSSAHKIHVVASAVKEHLPEYMTTMNTDLGTLSGGVCESLTPITIAIQPYYHGGPGE